MTEIYKEAILEAKKIREVAENDAKNKIIEAVSPIIKKILMKETTDAGKYLFGEEDDLANVADPGIEISDPSPGINPDDLSSVANPDVPNVPPISASGELAGMPMPDEEGKITLDFQQLFSLSGMGGAGAANSISPSVPAPIGAAGGGMDNALQTQTMDPAAGIANNLPPANAMQAPIDAPTAPGISPDIAGQAAQPPGTNPVAGTTTTPPPGQIPPAPPLTPASEEEENINQLAEEAITSFKHDVVVIAEKIDLIRTTKSNSLFLKEFVKNKLFALCESLDSLRTKGTISETKAKIVESKLEFLFSSLNEAKQDNSYKKDEGNKMTTLKEFAAKLFEEDALGPATADKATAHAEKVSGVQPGVDLFKEGEDCQTDDMKKMAESLLGEDAPASTAFGDGKEAANAETKSDKVHSGEALVKKQGAGVVGESAPASTAFGDGQKATGAENTSPNVHKPDALADEKGANTILEFDEKELMEAIAKVRKENLARKLASVKEGVKAGKVAGTDKDGNLKTPKVPEGDQGSAKPEGGKDPSQKNLKEETVLSGAETEETPDVSVSMGGDSDVGGGDDEVELSFQLNVDDLQALLSGGGVADFIAEPTSADSDVPSDIGGGDSDSDDTIEVVSDEGDGEGGEGILLDKETEIDEMSGASPAASAGAGKPAGMMQESAKKKINQLKQQLSESQLLTAKALYVSKFAVNKDLTSKQKQKIAEYFDKAKTLAEAKETYKKINKILSESMSSSNLSGSASKPTATGSARLLEESKNGSDSVEMQRWMLLAGIKAKK